MDTITFKEYLEFLLEISTDKEEQKRLNNWIKKLDEKEVL